MPWFFRWWFSLLRPRPEASSDVHHLALENLALRHQLALLQRAKRRPPLCTWDRILWVALKRFWPRWQSACVVVKPATVVAWHRAGFRALWRWKSRAKAGRRSTHADRVALIRRMAEENPLWGAPRIHGELRMLGIRISQATVARYLPKRPKPPRQGQTWKAFLANHREHLAAMDFFTVPTATFRQLYGLVILHHGRREVVHVNVTAHPTAAWVRQQLREAFPGDQTPKYLIFDRDTIFGATRDFIRSLGVEPKVIAYRSPWQNGVVERFMGTLRRELLNHVIVRDETHLLRLVKAFVAYYHEDRTHLGLGKETPKHRGREDPPDGHSNVKASPRLGGLHHRYTWNKAA
ncbi:MAG TPA: integrase core domain-containing protein [Holophagaceae bacterium]|nr:integrase core domain-containing protein [Holophagaceae bacterium]